MKGWLIKSQPFSFVYFFSNDFVSFPCVSSKKTTFLETNRIYHENYIHLFLPTVLLWSICKWLG